MVASILKILITRNTICDNLVGFPKSGHVCALASDWHGLWLALLHIHGNQPIDTTYRLRKRDMK